MRDLVSTVLSFFLSPVNLIVLLLLGSYFLRATQLKKTLKMIALGLFLLFSNQALLDWYAKKWQPAPVQIAAKTQYSCGIVLGGFGSPDAEANGYFNSAADRFIQVVKLYQLGKIQHILINGGNGKPDEKSFREASWVKNELKAIGIPDAVIFTEDRSDNTADNAQYAKIMLDSLQLKPPYLLITSAQHMPRAALVFKKAGLAVDPFPCNYTAGRGSFSWRNLIPSFSVLGSWNPFLKETAGYIWLCIK